MRILVTGCEGMLGRAVTSCLSPAHQVRGVDLKDGDLADRKVATRILEGVRPDWVVNCAAWTDVDGAEEHREQALAANADLPANLSRLCDRLGCGLTHLSTDYVFSGVGRGFAEDSPRAPVNHYGLTKARGEEAVERMTSPWQIVRTSWLFGDGPRNFVRTIAGLLSRRRMIRVVDDQRGNPTYTEDLAAVIEFLVTGGHRGIFHATNSGVCTWWEFARAIAAEAGCDPERVQPCPSSEYPRPAPRPACSILESGRLEAVGCPARPPWRDALSRYYRLLVSDEARYRLD